jgi:L-amino acid N-acyltransferase YncA
MIVTPTTPQEWLTMASMLKEKAGVALTPTDVLIGWVYNDKLCIVVAFTSWLGKTCQMHVAMEEGYHFSPKDMLRECFKYAFGLAGREVVFGVVNSKHERTMKYDQRLGFKEVFRYPGMHEDGGDIVLFAMTKEDCKWLDKEPENAAA